MVGDPSQRVLALLLLGDDPHLNGCTGVFSCAGSHGLTSREVGLLVLFSLTLVGAVILYEVGYRRGLASRARADGSTLLLGKSNSDGSTVSSTTSAGASFGNVAVEVK
jgi:hypothetical protein